MNKRYLHFFIPSIVLFLLFYLGPVLITFFYSFTNKALTGSKSLAYDFIGFKNFVFMYQDPRFKASVLRTIIFLVGSGLVGQQVLGFFLAILKSGKSQLFNRILGIAILIPWIMPEVVAGFTLYAYLGEVGTLNSILNYLGVSKIAWLLVFPMAGIIIANIWRGTAFSMMVYSSALDNIPKEIIESASLEGCSGLQKVTHIILPMLRETVFTNSILVTFQTIGMFGLIFLLTGGGPNGKTQTLPLFMYDQAFLRYQIGYGTAISLVLLLIGIIISTLYLSIEKNAIKE